MFMVLMILVFLIGYAAIAMEHIGKINKTAIALLMCVLCWIIYMSDSTAFLASFHPEEYQDILSAFSSPQDVVDAVHRYVTDVLLIEHMGDVGEIIFFLLGAMTIVEIVDMNGGFNFVRDRLLTQNKRRLLWRVSILSFCLSATLDNLTTTIVMLTVLNKLINKQEDRWYYASAIIIAANSGGAFSPIGDVTTIMLWIKGNVTSLGLLSKLFLPAVASCILPVIILQTKLKGRLTDTLCTSPEGEVYKRVVLAPWQTRAVFYLGVGGLIMVPVFKYYTGLPPFMGILLVFGILWIFTEILFRGSVRAKEEDIDTIRVNNILHKIDLSTILFFLGILLAVSALQETGALSSVGLKLEQMFHGNSFAVTSIIGVLSSIVDNVPLVASCMGMYDIVPSSLNYMVDGEFWLLLAYCAGVGGSMLIIGSAAGVIAMGMQRMTFVWYLKNISWIALAGYASGILVYWLQSSFLSMI